MFEEEYIRRKRRIKRAALALAGTLLVCISVYNLYKYYIDSPDNLFDMEERVMSDDYRDILYMENGASGTDTLAVVTPSEKTDLYDRIYPGRWVITMDVEYQRDKSQYVTVKVEKAVYDVYDISTGKRIWTIDLKNLSEENTTGYVLVDPAYTPYHFRDDGCWMWFDLRNEETGAQDLQIDINVETQEIKLVDWKTKEEKTLQQPKQPQRIRYAKQETESKGTEEKIPTGIFDDDVIGLLEANGFYECPVNPYNLYDEAMVLSRGIETYHAYPGVICIETFVKYLPEENEELYGEFPGLKEYDGDGDDVVLFYYQDKMTEEEIMRLLMEDGEEISFDGCVLKADDSKDGKEHEIHSFKEFYKWQK